MKWVRRLLIIILVGIFLFSAGVIAFTLYQYHEGDTFYEKQVVQFVLPQVEETELPEEVDAEETRPIELAPLIVDFDALQELNPDICGWIYCEDTVISYPMVQGKNNDEYLRHLYDHTYCRSGSIFIEEQNHRDFSDGNTIIYGHNMMNDSMFGTLELWKDQAYYEEHPIFWIMTPDQDYRVELLGGYTTNSTSDTYMIFYEPGDELEEYLSTLLQQSDFESHFSQEKGSRYVVLSTCSYVFSNARYVLHGKLIPVDSAGGKWKGKGK